MRNAIEKPLGRGSTRCGSAKGMFCPLCVRVLAHWNSALQNTVPQGLTFIYLSVLCFKS
jgi:hypothetical protein